MQFFGGHTLESIALLSEILENGFCTSVAATRRCIDIEAQKSNR